MQCTCETLTLSCSSDHKHNNSTLHISTCCAHNNSQSNMCPMLIWTTFDRYEAVPTRDNDPSPSLQPPASHAAECHPSPMPHPCWPPCHRDPTSTSLTTMCQPTSCHHFTTPNPNRSVVSVSCAKLVVAHCSNKHSRADGSTNQVGSWCTLHRMVMGQSTYEPRDLWCSTYNRILTSSKSMSPNTANEP